MLFYAIQAVLLLGFVAFAFRTLTWSLDSPVLRKALRCRKFSYATKMGLLAVVAVTIRLLRQFGDGTFSLSSLFFGTMFLLAGTALVLFCGFLLQDVKEVFLLVAQRLAGELPLGENADDESAECGSSLEATCRAEQPRHCGAIEVACGARTVTTHPRRPIDAPRRRQRR